MKMVEKCDDCGFEDIDFEIINGQEVTKLCRDCAEEFAFELMMSNNKISFEIQDNGEFGKKKIIVS